MRTGTFLLPLLGSGASPWAPPGAECSGISGFIPNSNVAQFPSLSIMRSFSYFYPNPTSFLPQALPSALSAPSKKQRYLGRS